MRVNQSFPSPHLSFQLPKPFTTFSCHSWSLLSMAEMFSFPKPLVRDRHIPRTVTNPDKNWIFPFPLGLFPFPLGIFSLPFGNFPLPFGHFFSLPFGYFFPSLWEFFPSLWAFFSLPFGNFFPFPLGIFPFPLGILGLMVGMISEVFSSPNSPGIFPCLLLLFSLHLQIRNQNPTRNSEREREKWGSGGFLGRVFKKL